MAPEKHDIEETAKLTKAEKAEEAKEAREAKEEAKAPPEPGIGHDRSLHTIESDKKLKVTVELKVGTVINPDVQRDREGFTAAKIHRITWVGDGPSVECQFDGPHGRPLLVSLPQGTETKTVKGERFTVTEFGLEAASEIEKPFHPPETHPGTGLPNLKAEGNEPVRAKVTHERRDVVDTGKTRAADKKEREEAEAEEEAKKNREARERAAHSTSSPTGHHTAAHHGKDKEK